MFMFTIHREEQVLFSLNLSTFMKFENATIYEMYMLIQSLF